MISVRRILRGPEHSVKSFVVQANEPVTSRETTVFEHLTRHLLDRLVHNEALGEEMPTRIAQMAYMFALPGALVALYLFAPYHQPRAIGPRPLWSQVSDHYFYTVYPFVLMGLVTVFEWDLLFPDLLDVFVLSVLPIPPRKLVMAHLLALAIFLALVLIGTNILGAMFFPAVADLHGMWWKHVIAHTVTVLMAGTFSAAFFIALQGGLLCLLGRRLFGWISPFVQACSILLLLTIVFLFPLLSRSLRPLLDSSSLAVRLFPPFWFLGLYERLLSGPAAIHVFAPPAKMALLGTAGAVAFAALSYPLAYARRVRHLVEGGKSSSRRSRIAHIYHRILHVTLLRSPQQRAIHHFITQTLFRKSQLRLYLSVYTGVALSLAISGILLLRIRAGHVGFGVSEWGVRSAIPVIVFLITIGLRTALTAPVGLHGSWVFRAIHGKPLNEHLQAVFQCVALYVGATTIAVIMVIHLVAPKVLAELHAVVTTMLVVGGLSVLVADVFFFRIAEIPFTATRLPKTTDLPISFVRYAVIFPMFVLYVVSSEAWIEASFTHITEAALLVVVAHTVMRVLHKYYLEKRAADPSPTDQALTNCLGLRD